MNSILRLLALLLFLPAFSIAQPIDFQYLGTFDAQGVPAYLVQPSDAIGSDLSGDIAKALPEREPVPARHPEYIQKSNGTDIHLSKEANVWVTFVQEAAGNANALGFYTYPLSNPPRTAADIQKYTIIFPNVSQPGSGGALNAGSKVWLGKFPANTGIGWFIAANGFKEGKVTAGNYLLYSEASFNPEPDASLQSHTVLLNDSKRAKVVLGFEDVRRDQGSDQDFNDILFYITADPYNAIKTDSLLNLDGSPAAGTGTAASTVVNNNTTNNTTTNTSLTNNTTNLSNTTVNSTVNTNTNVNTNANTNSNNNNGNTNSNNTTTIVNNTTIINNNNGNNNSNTNNASGTSGNGNTGNTGQTNGNGNTGNNGAGQSGNGSGNGNNGNGSAATPAYTSCSVNGMPSANFENLRSTIKAQRVESNKPVVIKQAVRGYQVTVSQVKEMLRLISVEQYRLDMAKFLYDHTCDQNNYFEVNALLNAGRVRDLEQYLKTRPVNNRNTTTSNRQRTGNRNQTTTVTNEVSVTNNNSAYHCHNGRMGEDDFDDLVSAVQRQSFSDSKMNILKEAVPGHCVNASQVKQLMNLFSFEADKLAVAKYLYPYTSDQQNYYKVNDAFSFSSSVDELKQYIKGE